MKGLGGRDDWIDQFTPFRRRSLTSHDFNHGGMRRV